MSNNRGEDKIFNSYNNKFLLNRCIHDNYQYVSIEQQVISPSFHEQRGEKLITWGAATAYNETAGYLHPPSVSLANKGEQGPTYPNTLANTLHLADFATQGRRDHRAIEGTNGTRWCRSWQPTRINAPGIEFANCESFSYISLRPWRDRYGRHGDAGPPL